MSRGVAVGVGTCVLLALIGCVAFLVFLARTEPQERVPRVHSPPQAGEIEEVTFDEIAEYINAVTDSDDRMIELVTEYQSKYPITSGKVEPEVMLEGEEASTLAAEGVRDLREELESRECPEECRDMRDTYLELMDNTAQRFDSLAEFHRWGARVLTLQKEKKHREAKEMHRLMSTTNEERQPLFDRGQELGKRYKEQRRVLIKEFELQVKTGLRQKAQD